MSALNGIIEAVHYTSEGQVAWVRAYERRGAVFSDCILLERASLVERLQSGQQFLVGRRLEGLGNHFDTSVPVRLVHYKGRELLVNDHLSHIHDHLDGVPVI